MFGFENFLFKIQISGFLELSENALIETDFPQIQISINSDLYY